MYKCKVVSCILLSLFYYYFINNIVIFYYIRLLFWLLLCVFFCHPVVSFLLYALPGCAVYLPMLPFAPSYHLYSVLLYNLCCSPKGFLKMEKKKKLNKACPEVIMYCYTSCGYANGYKNTHFWLWKIQNGEKNKGLLNLRTSLELFESLFYEMHVEKSLGHMVASRPDSFKQNTNQLIHSSQTTASQSASLTA